MCTTRRFLAHREAKRIVRAFNVSRLLELAKPAHLLDANQNDSVMARALRGIARRTTNQATADTERRTRKQNDCPRMIEEKIHHISEGMKPK